MKNQRQHICYQLRLSYYRGVNLNESAASFGIKLKGTRLWCLLWPLTDCDTGTGDDILVSIDEPTVECRGVFDSSLSSMNFSSCKAFAPLSESFKIKTSGVFAKLFSGNSGTISVLACAFWALTGMVLCNGEGIFYYCVMVKVSSITLRNKPSAINFYAIWSFPSVLRTNLDRSRLFWWGPFWFWIKILWPTLWWEL